MNDHPASRWSPAPSTGRRLPPRLRQRRALLLPPSLPAESTLTAP